MLDTCTNYYNVAPPIRIFLFLVYSGLCGRGDVSLFVGLKSTVTFSLFSFFCIQEDLRNIILEIAAKRKVRGTGYTVNPRIWKVTSRLIAQLNALPKTNQKIFGDSKIDSMKSMFLNKKACF